MIDHPNQFALDQKVLFRSRAEHGDYREWTAATIVVVRAADRKDKRRETPSTSQWEGTLRSDSLHAEDCEFVYYDMLPEGGQFDIEHHRKHLLCVCAYEIVPAYGEERWNGQHLAERAQYKLLLMDLERQGQEFNGYAQADNTVHLMVDGRLYATINTTDLLHWAAERAG